MKKTYIDIDWTEADLNMNNKEDKKLLNEIEAILEKYGYKYQIYLENTDNCIARYYHEDFIVKE